MENLNDILLLVAKVCNSWPLFRFLCCSFRSFVSSLVRSLARSFVRSLSFSRFCIIRYTTFLPLHYFSFFFVPLYKYCYVDSPFVVGHVRIFCASTTLLYLLYAKFAKIREKLVHPFLFLFLSPLFSKIRVKCTILKRERHAGFCDGVIFGLRKLQGRLDTTNFA